MHRLGLEAWISAAECLKEATSGSRWNIKLIVCWEDLIMKREHVELLELSTLRSALRSVVEEILDDKRCSAAGLKKKEIAVNVG